MKDEEAPPSIQKVKKWMSVDNFQRRPSFWTAYDRQPQVALFLASFYFISKTRLPVEPSVHPRLSREGPIIVRPSGKPGSRRALHEREALIRLCQSHWLYSSTVLQPQLWFRGGVQGKINRQKAKIDRETTITMESPFSTASTPLSSPRITSTPPSSPRVTSTRNRGRPSGQVVYRGWASKY